VTAALPSTDLDAARAEIAQLTAQLELARSIAVSLEQENARLTATVEELMARPPVWIGLGATAARAAAESVRAMEGGAL
jgi:chromosome condensin MukBEF ATPase and DNA-binding subunit MukB